MMSRVNGDTATWTIDRLARLAAAALADASPSQPNGRIREVPDVRTIRWYTSIGLLGRPAAMRGRTALYGRSHLAQLVAIKRLQAAGLTVAAVQERLLGADESAVEEIAELPADLDALLARVEAAGEPASAGPRPRPKPARKAEPAGGAEGGGSAGADGSAGVVDRAEAADRTGAAGSAGAAEALSPARAAEPAVSRTRFWATPPVPPLAEEGPASHTPTEPTADVAPAAVHGLRLAGDVTLLLPPGREPDAAARAAIAEAARPLLDLLDRLGLSRSA